MGIKLGGCVPLRGELGPHLTRCDKGGGLPKFPLDASNHLATIHQRHRQTGEKQTDIQPGQQSDSIGQTVFGRPFVKRFALCYRSVVCLSYVCLSVCNVGVLWPNSWTDQDETWHAGRSRPWPHCVRWGPSSPSPKGHSPQIFQHCARCMQIGISPGDFVLDGIPAPIPKRAKPHQYLIHVYCGQTATWIKTPLGTEVGLCV